MNLTFNPDTHEYRVDGIGKPSVTQILSNVGTRMTGSDGKKHWSPIGFDDRFFDDSGNASKFGDHFHFVAARIIQDIDVEYDPKMEPWIHGLKMFLHDNWKLIDKRDVSLIEIPMYSEEFGFAGTPDWYFHSDAGRFIIDWKTGVFQKHSRMQTAAYAQLVAELLNSGTLMHRWTVQILPGSYKIDKRYNHREDWNQFNSLLNVWKMS